ncbi:hypothetical protein BU24DRAFT_425657 [Aaosphaeria arxii CBS 175.79]|uniref:Rhodopsin domain-containing protein n=1 Tax=Aaosphaeria arxii CBS 175.79 TaxID=1450172 RepID=A0A6A5XFC2_9PLEO|nr:uncharacterized protein BU24DRAFT_425657 [Aaosphaeria arxii CBS 175.79]KAF2011828.1 hypothetical protein BU24DRAFT_425657 [Aaosphaeria arxii CBS 175.79]
MAKLPNMKPLFPGTLPPPPGVTPNIHFSQSKWNILTQVLCITITTIFILLRFVTKYVASLPLCADDWVSLGAWALSTIYSSLCLALGPLGIGIHAWNISPTKFQRFNKVGYVIEVLNGPAIFTTKLAILLLLIRIFRIKKRFVLFVSVFSAVLGLYYIATTLVVTFICNPVPKFWDQKRPGKCLNTNVIFICNCVVSLVTDVMILVLPLPVIWSLNMTLKQKIGSSFALAVGAVACVMGVLRLEVSVRTMDDYDKSYVFEPILLYSSGEIAIGIICGCIPVLPALHRYFKKGNKSSSYPSYGSGMPVSQRECRTMIPLERIPSTESTQQIKV